MTSPDPIPALRSPQGQEPDFWRCTKCGCLWRDNHDNTVSLASAKQTSCAECELRPTSSACEPLFRLALASASASVPDIGVELSCLLCGLVKPWGSWERGVAVCRDCRDAAWLYRRGFAPASASPHPEKGET